jgi:hypothetical protein
MTQLDFVWYDRQTTKSVECCLELAIYTHPLSYVFQANLMTYICNLRNMLFPLPLICKEISSKTSKRSY